MLLKRQYKVRLIARPSLPPSARKPNTIADTATAMAMKPTSTPTKWPAAKLTPVPLTIYKMPVINIQEIPSPQG